jgi:hypothetical protein
VLAVVVTDILGRAILLMLRREATFQVIEAQDEPVSRIAILG